MDKHELLERYEAQGDESDFRAALPLYEEALAESPSAQLLHEYGYLLECHGRYAIRKAVAHYERAIELEPDADASHMQLIFARGALLETEAAVALYKRRLAEAPDDVREYRFLARAYLAAHEHAEAATVVDAGLELAPEDALLIEYRGDVRAATGDSEGALQDWRRALELAPELISPAYSSAFLLEREGRIEEAAESWASIVDWLEARDYDLQADWPRRELARLRAQLDD